MDQHASQPMHTVQDVLIHIQRAGDQGYPVELITWDGETYAWMVEQFPQLHELNRVANAERQNPEGVSIWLYTLGCTLFNTLRDGIPPGVADWLAHLREREQALRLRLWIDDPQVAALPWELMHHAQTREWLLQSPWFSLVRSQLNVAELGIAAAYTINRMVADDFFTHMHRSLQQGNDFESSFNTWRRGGSFDLEWYRGLPMLLETQSSAPTLALFWLQVEPGESAPRLVVLSIDDFWRYAAFEDYLRAAAQPEPEEPNETPKDALGPDLGDLSRPAWERETQPWDNQPIGKEFTYSSDDLDELLKGLEDWENHLNQPDELTGTPKAPVTRGDQPPSEMINAQDSQGFINHPSGPVTQNFGTQYHLNGTVINMPPAPDKIIGSLDLRLDTAVPEQVYLNESFKLAVAIRLPTSPALDLPGLPGHFNEAFEADELESVPLMFRIEVQESSAYRIVGPTFHLVRYRKGKDSPAFYFELIPLHLGEMEIVINVLQEMANVGAMRLMTTALDPALKSRGQVAAQIQVVAAEPSRGAPEPSRLADVEAALHRLVDLLTQPEARANTDQWITALCQEARRGDQANAARVQQIFNQLRSSAPEICYAAAGALRLPVRGVGGMLRQIAESEFQRGTG